MNDPDQDLATLLAALKAAEPPDGMERRILNRLAAAQSIASTRISQNTRSQSQPNPRWSSLSLSASARSLLHSRPVAPLTLAAALILSLMSLHQHRLPTPTRRATTASTTVSPATSTFPTSPIDTESNLCCRSEQSTGFPNERTGSLGWSEESLHVAHHHGAPRRTHILLATPHSHQLASFPAPPMPLTPQEKLLLQVAHAPNPQQSPVLNPALRAGLAARENEEFQLFFASATTIKPNEPSN